jgi:hypothetical protein
MSVERAERTAVLQELYELGQDFVQMVKKSPRIGQRVNLINRCRKGSLDILPSLSYTYDVSLRCKYRKAEDHGEIW